MPRQAWPTPRSCASSMRARSRCARPTASDDPHPLHRHGVLIERPPAQGHHRRAGPLEPVEEAARYRRRPGARPPSSTPTAPGSCTATSSRATSWSPPKGQVKVMDFGIARAISDSVGDRSPRRAQIVGTAAVLLARAGASGETVDARSRSLLHRRRASSSCSPDASAVPRRQRRWRWPTSTSTSEAPLAPDSSSPPRVTPQAHSMPIVLRSLAKDRFERYPDAASDFRQPTLDDRRHAGEVRRAASRWPPTTSTPASSSA